MRALRIILLTASLLVSAAPAHAAWSLGANGDGAAKALSVPQGALPTATQSNRDVSLSWDAVTLPNGAAVTGYEVFRYDSSGAKQAAGGDCAGTINALSCTETGLPAGSWTYTVRAVYGPWHGAESPASTAVAINAAELSFTNSSVTSLPATISGSLANFKSGQTLTYRLDDPTTGALLSATTTPTPVPSSGSATVSVTIPVGTSHGSHVVYAIGSGGDLASAPITVDAVDHFTIDAVPQQHSGRSFLITVRARDSSGATVGGFAGSVAISTNSGTISPTQSSSFANGVLTQSVTIDGAYNSAQLITVGANGKSGTSNTFVLNDWRYYFKKTTAETGTGCGSATRLRDMAQGYAGAEPEELFSRTTGGATHLRFCSPTFAAGDTLAAGTTTVEAWTTNTAGSGCAINATIYKISGAITTALGSTSLTIPNASATTLRTWTIATAAASFAAGDRLSVSFALQEVKACDSTNVHYGGTARRSNVQFPGPGS